MRCADRGGGPLRSGAVDRPRAASVRPVGADQDDNRRRRDRRAALLAVRAVSFPLSPRRGRLALRPRARGIVGPRGARPRLRLCAVVFRAVGRSAVLARGNSTTGAEGLHDDLTALMRFPGGRYAVITQTLAAFQYHQFMEVVGSEGAIRSWWSGTLDRTLEPSFEASRSSGAAITSPRSSPSSAPARSSSCAEEFRADGDGLRGASPARDGGGGAQARDHVLRGGAVPARGPGDRRHVLIGPAILPRARDRGRPAVPQK